MDVNVAYQDIEVAAKALTDGQTDIENILAKLKSAMETLTSEGFKTDQASGKFQESYNEFTTGAKNTIDGLTGMSSYLKQVSTTFQDTDKALSSI